MAAFQRPVPSTLLAARSNRLHARDGARALGRRRTTHRAPAWLFVPHAVRLHERRARDRAALQSELRRDIGTWGEHDRHRLDCRWWRQTTAAREGRALDPAWESPLLSPGAPRRRARRVARCAHQPLARLDGEQRSRSQGVSAKRTAVWGSRWCASTRAVGGQTWRGASAATAKWRDRLARCSRWASRATGASISVGGVQVDRPACSNHTLLTHAPSSSGGLGRHPYLDGGSARAWRDHGWRLPTRRARGPAVEGGVRQHGLQQGLACGILV